MEYNYEKRIVAFIDVLGFGALVDSSADNAPNKTLIIKQIVDALGWVRDELLEDMSIGFCDPQFSHFSDSFVISAKIGDHLDLPTFMFYITSPLELLLYSGLLCRGGVTIGELFHRDGLVFGPAMNRAYHIESRIAYFPRIIIDGGFEELIKHLGNANHAPRFLIEYFQTVDSDGHAFVEYIEKIRKAYYLIPSYLVCVQKTILNIPERTESLINKKLWLIDKYNRAVANFSLKELRKQMDDTINSMGCNWKVLEEDYERILADAQSLHPIRLQSGGT